MTRGLLPTRPLGARVFSLPLGIREPLGTCSAPARVLVARMLAASTWSLRAFLSPPSCVSCVRFVARVLRWYIDKSVRRKSRSSWDSAARPLFGACANRPPRMSELSSNTSDGAGRRTAGEPAGTYANGSWRAPRIDSSASEVSADSSASLFSSCSSRSSSQSSSRCAVSCPSAGGMADGRGRVRVGASVAMYGCWSVAGMV